MNIEPYRNMSVIDRLLRCLIGCAFILIAINFPNIINNGVINTLIACFGALNVVSALFGVCPAYYITNFSTSLKKRTDAPAGSIIAGVQTQSLDRTEANKYLDKTVIRKLLVSILIPSVALLVLFGILLYQLKSELFLGEVASRGNAVSHLAMGLAAAKHVPKQSSLADADLLYRSALTSVAALVFHDSTGTLVPTPLQKIPPDSYLLEKMTSQLVKPDSEDDNQMLMHNDKMYLTTSVSHPNNKLWVTALVHCDIDHAVLSTIGTARFLVITVMVLWLSGWSAVFVIRKYVSRISEISGEIEFRNTHDDLTGLPNRLMVSNIINSKSREIAVDGGMLSVILLDLIGFRDINDTLGHGYGDKLLVSIATELQKLDSNSISVAHFGADVFCLVCNSGNDLAVTYTYANKVHDVLDQFSDLDGTPIVVHCRMGISSYPTDTENFSDMIRLADIALSQSKQSNLKISNYKREKDSHTVRKLSLLARLRGAIEDDELQLVYQPKVNIQTGEMVGVEALVRWTDTEFGVVSPIEFVSWAEKSGLVDKLTEWVLETAGAQSYEWQTMGYSIPIAINLSPINFHSAQLLGQVEKLINEGKFNDGLLELEITENAVMSDPAVALDCMMQLDKLGVPFAIDDFGTGMSSFTYLRKFPVSNLKIDKEFVMGEVGADRDSILLCSMIELGHNLGCVVTAEGVEDQQTLDRLVEFGCDLVQGYHVCKPVSPDVLLEWIERDRWELPRQAA